MWKRLVAITLVVTQIVAMGPVVVYAEEVEASMRAVSEGPSASENITAKEGGIVRLGGAEVQIPAGALDKDTEIKITRLWRTEDTGEEMKNVTAGGG
ncbi:MAG: hypothetical protein LBV17_01910, partial [Treponema sp.]|nr:hypothetical protein [Treponema sp.]